MTQYLIYGDIGGTKTLVHAARLQGQHLEPVCEHRYDSRAHQHFEDIFSDFLQRAKCQPAALCLAVAGPIAAQRVELTNLSWVMDATQLARQFSIPAVQFLNCECSVVSTFC